MDGNYKWILALLCFAMVPEFICQPAKMPGQWNIYQATEYPNPLTDPTKCQTSRPSGLCDPNKMFLPETRESIIKALENLEGVTKENSSFSAKECLCNKTCTEPTIKIVVAIMKKLGPDIMDYGAEAKEIAKRFKELWNLHNCTVVFVASVNDSTCHAEAGSEVISLLNKTITDSIDKRISEDFLKLKPEEGVNEMLELYRKAINETAARVKEEKEKEEKEKEEEMLQNKQTVIIIVVVILVIVILVGIVLCIYFFKTKKEKHPRNKEEAALYKAPPA